MWGCEIGGEENFSERLCLLFLGIGSDLNEDLELWVQVSATHFTPPPFFASHFTPSNTESHSIFETWDFVFQFEKHFVCKTKLSAICK